MAWTKNPNPTQKPPLGSIIDWSHPLARGLVGCWLLNEGGGDAIYDMVENRKATISGLSWGSGKLYNYISGQNGSIHVNGSIQTSQVTHVAGIRSHTTSSSGYISDGRAGAGTYLLFDYSILTYAGYYTSITQSQVMSGLNVLCVADNGSSSCKFYLKGE